MHKAGMFFGVRATGWTNWLVLALCVCASVFARQAERGTVLLVSIDGFRWDYSHKVPTPNLNRIAKEGIKAGALIPVFPTMTFPAHYSMLTGLHPEQHGIIGNIIRDPKITRDFNMRDRESMQNTNWWGGEPIWITAQRQGLKSGTCFWPGTDVEVSGGRPTYWLPFDGAMPNEQRIAQVIDWLQLPEEKRPQFLTIYFGEVDKAGHRYGPDSGEVAQAIGEADNALGTLMHRLQEIGRNDVNVIVVSDHGMTAISRDRVIVIDEYVNMRDVIFEDAGELVLARAKAGKENSVLEQLERIPRVKFYRKEQLPQRLHFRASDRIPPIIGIPEDGWMIFPRASLAGSEQLKNKGMHGFDNAYPSMHGIFVARGPAFGKGLEIEAFSAVNIYGLVAKILRIRPAQNDGDLKTVEMILKGKE